MLPQCNLEITEREVAMADVEALVRSCTEKAGEVFAFMEPLRQVSLLPLRKIAFEDILPDLRRLVVFASDFELRFEYTDEKMYCRLLRETAGTGYVWREDTLLLHSNATQEQAWYNDGRGGVLCREYFAADRDGMYVFKADRLAGLLSSAP